MRNKKRVGKGGKEEGNEAGQELKEFRGTQEGN